MSLLIRGIAATAAIAFLAITFAMNDADGTSIDAAASAPLHALAATILALTTAAAILLLRQRRTSMLDLWLMVAMTAWLIEVLLEALARDGTSLAWHIAQLYGVLGATRLDGATEHAHVRLIELETDTQLWSGSFEANLDEPGAVEDAWNAEGWLRVDAPIPERWNLRLVRWTRSETTVEPVPVDPDGSATVSLDPTAVRSVLVIAPTAPRTLVHGEYSVTVTPL